MTARGGNDKGLETGGDDLSLDHPNTHPGRCLFYLRSQSKEKAGPSVLARVLSPRLVSFLLDLGKLPKLDLGVLANDEHPGSSHAGQICATFEIHTVELEDNHSQSLHRTIIAHPHQPTTHFTPPVGFSQLCLLLRLTRQSINPSTAPERPPANQTVQLSHPLGQRLDPYWPCSRD